MKKDQLTSTKHLRDKKAVIPTLENEGMEEEIVFEKKKIYDLDPIINRDQDPHLVWLDKYKNDNYELEVDVRSLYRSEHIAPEIIIKNLYRLREHSKDPDQLSLTEMFGNSFELDEFEKISHYYKHTENWTNRMILGDSLLVMNSLVAKESMQGKVQMIYLDPPYGIKYGSNWQIRMNDRNVKDNDDAYITHEPEQIKAFRDTWELGIHSYLSYLRDRLLVAKELLTESGSCFVQISDENLHLVRCLLDEIFGSENFCNIITVRKTGSVSSPNAKLSTLGTLGDFIIWYSKNKDNVKYRQVFSEKLDDEKIFDQYNLFEMEGDIRRLKSNEIRTLSLEQRLNIFQSVSLESNGYSESFHFPVSVNNRLYRPAPARHWSTTEKGISKLLKLDRILVGDNKLRFKKYLGDFPATPIGNIWTDLMGTNDLQYVVQTNGKIIERCLLMTTDPGDLVIDPTCGSGTTAYVAEHWGRRWITIDTSRIALNIAKQRLMTAVYPYYKLYDDVGKDIRQGFIYKKVPHITLKSLANDEPPEEETLYDQPELDKNILRVAGSFTVETLQSLNPISPEELEERQKEAPSDQEFEERIFSHLRTAGIRNGIKNEHARFVRIDKLTNQYLHAEGYYSNGDGEKKAYIHIGPKFGSVSKKQVSEAFKEARLRKDANWLVILGFSFEADVENITDKQYAGLQVTKVRMHDDLLQEDLSKKDRKGASFVTIGEPDISVNALEDGRVQVEVCGLDLYDPIKDEVKSRSLADINYWYLDDDYNGSEFVTKQIFFCGGDKNAFDKVKRSLTEISKRQIKKKAEQTLRLEIDEEVFDNLYGFQSFPIEVKDRGHRVAVKVVSQFGEESMKVIEVTK
ncbi:site-specific DNA-methyltransferase [Xanthocytophaga agilis]|uniref:Site-specific DNA-methyltransferase n=1 Tax=Xanthocytophaga agilis TaxID=3048010 RepID=A0AAE3R5J1_9BACT|nr:site-specific DNA-methyltransferase [Xanthocytophaga agilis]MDJ1501844.1 site-specific DNA-methyltransferase [Xanthocytophaga agilis]